MTQQLDTTSPKQVIEWAEKRGTRVLVNLPGSHGDHYVEVNKKDFILKMSLMVNPLRETELSSTYYFEPVRKTIYTA